MASHKIGTQEEWATARADLQLREEEHARLGDELARQRRELPWVPIEKDYRFETEDGTKTLTDLFDGRSQLMVYHFMFGPSWNAGCPACSSIADTLAPQVPPPEGEGHHAAARLPSTASEAPRLPQADGMAHRLDLERGQRLQP